jgi:hypothetical protein
MIPTAYEKYINAGLACLPTGADKVPAIPKGSSWKGGWNNRAEYESSHGIGILCGKVSGNLEIIDFDNSFGDIQKIFEAFLDIEDIKQIIEKYDFPIQRTKRAGYHLIYRCDLIEGNQKLAERYRPEGKKEALIETRGEGGYFCVDPTPGYKRISGEMISPPVITAEDRIILLSACRSFNEAVKPTISPEEDTDKPGDIYNRSSESQSEMISALKESGWKEINEGIWRRPGKDKGISATLGKAHPGIFYNFSSNGHPFENNHGYNAFQVVGLIKYAGDFKRFAKELYERQNPNRTSAPERKTVTAKTNPEQNSDPDQTYSELEKQLRVDLTAEPTPAPALLYLKNNDKLIPSFTLQNFSLITGKAKSRKTFLTVLIVASYLGYLNDLIQADPERKGTVLIIDTEQSPYHLHRMMKRICRLIEVDNPHRLQAYGLKTLTPEEKASFIEYKLKTTPDIIMVVIDGVRDLVYDINSPEEATKTSVRLMKWCAIHNIHILNVLHQNKGDGNARGHLGTELVNKAETVLSVNLEGDKTISTVESEYSRELDCSTFSFSINDDSLPVICGTPEKESENKRIPTPNQLSDDKHYQVLSYIYKKGISPTYSELMDFIIEGFGYTFRHSICRAYISYYLTKGWIKKERDCHKVIYKYEKATF